MFCFSGKQVNTHAEWEDRESLRPVGSKFHYFHDSKYSVKSVHTYIVIFLEATSIFWL